MSSFAKMLKEKGYRLTSGSYVKKSDSETYFVLGNKKELIGIRNKDLGEWFWRNGGKQHAEHFIDKGLDDFKLMNVYANSWAQDSIDTSDAIRAFCFLRVVDLMGRAWVESKIKGMGKE